jgi:hypothetical protein
VEGAATAVKDPGDVDSPENGKNVRGALAGADGTMVVIGMFRVFVITILVKAPKGVMTSVSPGCKT